jgi:hypothetical protein
MDLKETDCLGDNLPNHWYYVSKGRVLTDLLVNRHIDTVVDVGAGSGVFSRLLLERGICDRAICVDSNYVEDSDQMHRDKPLLLRRSLTPPTGSAVLMMDVLEHVDDDDALLRKYTDSLPTGASVVVTVPAFRFLWSGHDVFLEHRRRYRLGEVEALLRAAGLEPQRGRYFFGLLFPLVAIMRLFDRLRLRAAEAAPKSALKTAPAWLNRLLILVHDLERHTLYRVNRLAGLSAVVLARKL